MARRGSGRGAADVARWAGAGLISAEQAEAIRAFEEREGGRRGGLSLATVATYFGAFMILFAYTVYVGTQWEGLSRAWQLGIAAGTVAALCGAGALLHRWGERVAGGLLVFAGAGVVPLLAYTVQRALGLWPDESLRYEEFYQLVRSQWIIMEVAGVIAAALAARLTRFPLATLLAAFWCWYLSMDLARWLSDAPPWAWGDREQIVSAAVGGAMLAAGLLLQRRADRDYSLWLYIFGHMAVLGGLAALAFTHEGLWGLLFLGVYLGFVAASVALQRRVFLVFGALGCYAYTSYLAFRVFEGSLGFSFALAAVGLLVLLSAVAYRRLVAGWLGRRLAPAA